MNLQVFIRLSGVSLIYTIFIFINSSSATPIIIPPDIIYEPEVTAKYKSNSTDSTPSPNDENPASTSMSAMWYLVSFGGLVTFFLLLSFSEFCCRKTPTIPVAVIEGNITAEPTAPPPYELFAPPAYDSLFRDITKDRKRSIRASVFLIPVHDKSEIPRESPLEFGEVIRRNPMGDGEVVTPPPPP